jgi:hypothetical protein
MRGLGYGALAERVRKLVEGGRDNKQEVVGP